jgi:hypothetical protein
MYRLGPSCTPAPPHRSEWGCQWSTRRVVPRRCAGATATCHVGGTPGISAAQSWTSLLVSSAHSHVICWVRFCHHRWQASVNVLQPGMVNTRKSTCMGVPWGFQHSSLTFALYDCTKLLPIHQVEALHSGAQVQARDIVADTLLLLHAALLSQRTPRSWRPATGSSGSALPAGEKDMMMKCCLIMPTSMQYLMSCSQDVWMSQSACMFAHERDRRHILL